MKIISIAIKNFRSIQEALVSGPSDDVWTSIGQNNAGKSSVLHAIRAFYGEYDVTAEDFCRLGADNSQIEITIDYRLDDEEHSQLPEYYKLPENRLRVVKRFSKENLKGSAHGFENKDGTIRERDEEFFGAKNVQIGKLGNVIYIPAVKDLSEELKKTKSSIFSKLVSRIISEALTSLPSWTGLVDQAQAFAIDLRSPTKDENDGELNSVHEIEKTLAEMLSSWRLQPQIVVSPPTPEDIVLAGSKLRFLSQDTGHEEDPLILGSGAQRSIVNNLLLLWARIESKKKKVDQKKFNGDLTILLYEEPEALLHYDQEKKILKDLEEIATSETNQVLICTHSPNLISTKSKALKSISRYVKTSGGTKIFRAGQQYLDEIAAEESVFDFILWLNSDRNTMFFVDHVFLVEGASDKVLLNYLINERDININAYVVDCGSKSHIPRFMQLCAVFGISHSVMFDRDNDSSDDHKRWNSSIESARSTYTRDIKDFALNLEEYIGFETGLPSYKKTVEMLNQLRAGKLSAEKEKEFLDWLSDVQQRDTEQK